MKQIILFVFFLVFAHSASADICDVIDIKKELKHQKRNINTVHVDKYFCFSNKGVKNFDFNELDEFGYKYGLDKNLSFQERYTMFYPLKKNAEMKVKIIMTNGSVYYVNMTGNKSIK